MIPDCHRFRHDEDDFPPDLGECAIVFFKSQHAEARPTHQTFGGLLKQDDFCTKSHDVLLPDILNSPVQKGMPE